MSNTFSDIFLTNLGEPKISQLEVAFFIDEEVVWLDISMHNSNAVKVLQCHHRLCNVPSAHILRHSANIFEHGSKVTSDHKFHD